MKKRVVFFVNDLYGGGAEKVLHTLLRHLDRDRFDITIYSLHNRQIGDGFPDGITYRYIYGHNKVVDYFKTFIYKNFSPSLFYRLFVHGIFDTEVAFIEGYSTRIVSGSTNKLSKKIAWVHIDLEQNHWTDVAYHSREEEMMCYGVFDVVVAVSRTVKLVNERLFSNIKNSLFIYNPISSDEILTQSQKGIKIKYEKKEFSFVTCGRLTKQKGFDRLIDAVNRLFHEGYLFEVVIIGEGEERKNLERQIDDNSLEKVVSLMGFMENPHPLIKGMDCFVCSSRTEGFPLVILEAMILGLPVLATNCTGPNEIIGNSEYGLLVNNSVDGLYEGMKWLLDNPHEMSVLREKSSRRSVFFDLGQTIKKIENIL